MKRRKITSKRYNDDSLEKRLMNHIDDMNDYADYLEKEIRMLNNKIKWLEKDKKEILIFH